jgi:hypothetical protein
VVITTAVMQVEAAMADKQLPPEVMKDVKARLAKIGGPRYGLGTAAGNFKKAAKASKDSAEIRAFTAAAELLEKASTEMGSKLQALAKARNAARQREKRQAPAAADSQPATMQTATAEPSVKSPGPTEEDSEDEGAFSTPLPQPPSPAANQAATGLIPLSGIRGAPARVEAAEHGSAAEHSTQPRVVGDPSLSPSRNQPALLARAEAYANAVRATPPPKPPEPQPRPNPGMVVLGSVTRHKNLRAELSQAAAAQRTTQRMAASGSM